MLVGHQVEHKGRFVDAFELQFILAEEAKTKKFIAEQKLKDAIERRDANELSIEFLSGEQEKYIGEAPAILKYDLKFSSTTARKVLNGRVGGLTAARNRLNQNS